MTKTNKQSALNMLIILDWPNPWLYWTNTFSRRHGSSKCNL